MGARFASGGEYRNVGYVANAIGGNASSGLPVRLGGSGTGAAGDLRATARPSGARPKLEIRTAGAGTCRRGGSSRATVVPGNFRDVGLCGNVGRGIGGIEVGDLGADVVEVGATDSDVER